MIEFWKETRAEAIFISGLRISFTLGSLCLSVSLGVPEYVFDIPVVYNYDTVKLYHLFS